MKEKKIKILKIWSTFQTEFKYHDHYLSENMIDNNVETTFLTSDKIDSQFLPFLENKTINAGNDFYYGSRIIRLKSLEIFGKPFIIDTKKMYKELCINNYDLIHINGIGNPITFLTLLILRIYGKKTPLIINDHSNPNLKNKSIIGAIYYKINILLFSVLKDMVKLIITPNLASFKFIKKHYGIKKGMIRTIPLGFDSKTYFYNKTKINKELILGFAGKITPEKRLEVLIDVLTNINDSNIICEIVGINQPETKYQQSLKEYARKCKVDIRFRPLIKNSKKLAEFYNYIDVAIFPGSISITTIEASGCGTPVLLYKSIEGLEDRVYGNRGYLFTRKRELEKYILHYRELKKKKEIPNSKIQDESLLNSWQEISKEYFAIYKYYIEL